MHKALASPCIEDEGYVTVFLEGTFKIR